MAACERGGIRGDEVKPHGGAQKALHRQLLMDRRGGGCVDRQSSASAVLDPAIHNVPHLGNFADTHPRFREAKQRPQSQNQ